MCDIATAPSWACASIGSLALTDLTAAAASELAFDASVLAALAMAETPFRSSSSTSASMVDPFIVIPLPAT